MLKLQVLIDGKWQYVFCRNELFRNPITTENKAKAIKFNDNTLAYFENHFANHQFKGGN